MELAPQDRQPDIPAPEDDEMVQIQEELHHTTFPGYGRRMSWLLSVFQDYAGKLALGKLTDDRARHQAEGRCQVLQEIFDRDGQLRERLREMTAEQEDRGDEGGDLGVGYEAAGQ